MRNKELMYKRLLMVVSTFLIIIIIICFTVIAIGRSHRNELEQKYSTIEKQYKDLDKKYIDLDKKYKEIEKKRMIRNDNKKKKIINLTFDDGPSENTLEVLATLKKNNVKATFFVINTPEDQIYKDIVAQGHKIGLHSYSHDYEKIYKNNKAFMKDINKLRNKVYKLTGVKSDIFRFPGGSSNTIVSNKVFNEIKRSTRDAGLEYYDWNCDSTDASGSKISVKNIVKNSSQCINLNSINLLMHDGVGHKNTAKAVQDVIDFYQSKGYVFEAISEGTPLVHHKD
ncbi:MAG: polysaccharide deacetylase family protein [Erysipelotrichales bacterium]